MIHSNNPILTNQGVKVFGSAIVRVTPDTASIVVAVSRIEHKPEEAFAKAREAAQSVNAYLHQAGIKDFGSSRITLSEAYRYIGGQNTFVGYDATIGFNIVIREMDRVDNLLTGVLTAGANSLTSVTFQTTRLKNLRAEARRRAVVAAREKAELYCEVAGVTVGNVLAIEDVNPDVLTKRSTGHSPREQMPIEDDGNPGVIDPGAITVGAAVDITYQIIERS